MYIILFYSVTEKPYGASCESVEECAVPAAVCNVTCQCPDTMYYDNLACLDSKFRIIVSNVTPFLQSGEGWLVVVLSVALEKCLDVRKYFYAFPT